MSELNPSTLNNWLKFKHLCLIETLARTQNMHLTAEQMNLSQPAISKMLKEIEHLIGFAIFERLPRSMPVTALGQHVVNYAQCALNDAQHFVEDIETLRLGGHGYLKVGGIFAATAIVIPQAIIAIKQKWPLLSIDVVEQTSDHLMQMLSEHTLDLAIGRFTNPTQTNLFEFQPLCPEPFCIVVNEQHPLAQQKHCNLSELIEWPWVLYPKGTPIRDRMERAFIRANVKLPQNTVNTISMQTFLQILQHSPTVGMLPEAMVSQHIAEGRLHILETGLKLEAQDYGILTRKGENISAISQAFIQLLLENKINNI
ncbi:LysR family transcriptional regulator [Acinetobacter sp. MD2(2019)]|uniref:LysR family transcriptional regulator n=1 Tax=Acinetobacter sp. MD2(2019) TaxID=2605273 RepID=UPI002D1E525C|nr:LysR family transcriptional regulator [Acinetobacter sp. MD2(2019)]MEB3752763.1 LysR family transcriptional regulator [Acinetobacter sp. MD2(2019)]